MSVSTPFGLDDHIDTFFIFFDDRQGAAGGLQQGRQLSFHKSFLFVRIAQVTERRSHVQRAAKVAFKKNVIAAEMNLSVLARRVELLQVAVGGLGLFVSLV